ncbi:MAG: hypothetical protein HQK57_02845 [Deltaproteobacteria bacterium]|nr:hypothetical protein [Deltaproteobacteria bacterium]
MKTTAISYPFRVMVDTSFWIALYDIKDRRHSEAVDRESVLTISNVILPWPILYETLRTRFVKRPWGLQFRLLLSTLQVSHVCDTPYRQRAYDDTVSDSNVRRGISMVDMLIRLMLEDKSLGITHLLTFNVKDFEDVCRERRIELV